MPAFKITLLGLFISLALGSKCPQDAITKLVVCYYNGETSLTDFNICNCTHLVFTRGVGKAENNSIAATEDTTTLLELVKERKENLSVLFTFETKQEETSAILKSENRSQGVIDDIVDFLQESHFDGVELNLKFTSDDGVPKESYASFVKNLSKALSSNHRRTKREGYDVFEKVTDDITTASYTTQTPKNSTSKTQSIKGKKPKGGNRKIREENTEKPDDGKEEEEEEEDGEENADYVTLEEAINAEFAEEKTQNQITLEDVEKEDVNEEKKFLVFVRLSTQPEIVAKKYDLKALSRYSDILMVPTHNIVNSAEEHLTYHPSRLMGLSDILNTDSILDFLTGMGAVKSKMVISLPASVLKFQLKEENKNTPRSPALGKPQVIDQSQLCSLFNKNNWTIERDDDLTAPYAFSGKTWLAFEDEISVNIKGKYILLRDLAGGAIYPIDADVNDGLCTNRTGSGGYLSGVLHRNFQRLERKPRALVLQNLQEEIHDTAYTNIEAGVKLSEYRIVRVVDHSGAVHVIRKNTKTQFECSRQGYFSHPLGCNKFYRCVKFDQYSDEFTVFEYDCPAGLAFDERWEVCVWPGSLPHGAPCTGSSEIAPVPRSHYQCPNHEGYYADPENCRWFFACLDHARDGRTPLTAYEFRCPFGLVFSQEKLACDWPWLVGTCGNKGAAGYLQVNAGGQSQGFHTATFVNGGNLEASLGQYGNTDEEASFVGFGKKFGSGLRGASAYNAQGAYQGAQSAGFGYIANQFEDHSDRASFAAFPDYQISGGRILNKGGVVLDQHVAGISGAGAGGTVGISGIYTGRAGASEIYRGAGITGDAAGVYGGAVGASGITGGAAGVYGGAVGVSGITGGEAGTSGIHEVAVGASGITAGEAGISGIYRGAEITGGTAGASGVYGGAVGVSGITGGEAGTSGIYRGAGITGGTAGASGVYGGAVGVSGITAGEAGTSGIHRAAGITGGTAGVSGVYGGAVGVSGITAGEAGTSGIHGGAVGASGITGGEAGIYKGVVGEAGITGGAAGVSGISGGAVTLSEISGGAANGFAFTDASKSSESGFYNQGIGQFGTGIQTNVQFQKLQPVVHTNTLEISGINSGGQASFQSPVSTPRPFAVNIPSVQINSEKVSGYSGHSTVAQTTPQTVVFKQTPQPESVHFTGKAVSGSQGFTVSQPTFGLSAVTPTTATHTFGAAVSGGTGTSHFSTPAVSFASTPKPEIHRFGQSQFTNRNQAAVTVPVITGTGSFKYSSGVSSGQAVPVTVPVVTPKPGISSFEYTVSGAGVSQSVSTENPFAGFTQVNHRISGGKSLGNNAAGIVQNHINAGLSGNSGVSYGSSVVTATPSVFTSVGKIGGESHLSTVYSGPTPTPFVHSTVDEKVSNEIRFNTPSSSFAVPTVTPKTDFNAFSKAVDTSGLNINAVTNQIPLVTVKPDYQVFSQTGKTASAVTYGAPAVTPQPNLNSFKSYGGQSSGVGVTPVVSFDSSANSFGQTAGVVKGFSGTTYDIPQSNVFQGTSTFQQTGISQSEKTSYSVPVVPTAQTFVTPKPDVKFSQPAGFGQQYSYSSSFKKSGGQFSTIQPFGVFSSTQTPIIPKTDVLVPKFQQSNVLIEHQQPVAAVGTVSTNSAQTISTPSTFSSGFPQSPVVSSIHFKSTYVQPQPVAVTTPAPVVSFTPSTPVVVNQPSFSVFGKSSGPTLQQTVVSAPGGAIFNQKSFSQQDIKTFTPVVTTPAPTSYNQDIGFGSKTGFYSQTAAYSPPVTPKVFGSTLQQSAGHFGTTERSQFSVQKEEPINFGFKTFEGKRTEFVQPQLPVQVTTLEYQPVVTTTSKPFTPREKLVELEIAKSIEIHQADFTKSAGGSPSPIEIQQQPVNLISEKTIRVKPLQPFFTQQEQDIVNAQINSIPQEQYVFQQQVNVKTPTVQKQYVPPAVTPKPVFSYSTPTPVSTYSTPKSVFTGSTPEPVFSYSTPKPLPTYSTPKPVFSYSTPKPLPTYSTPKPIIQQPALPVFETSGVPVTTPNSIIANFNENSSPAGIVKAPAFVSHFENRQPQEISSQVNLLLPTVTELPHYTPEELSLQTHQSFDSKKITKFGSGPVQNVFIQPEIPSTLKPSVNVFETSGHLFQYNGVQNLTNGIKYAINPNIAIPEPPREYILAQNAYTTVAPEAVTTGQFHSTESIRSGVTESAYLPPRRKPAKTTVVSVGSLNEGELREDNIQDIFDKYSGRFGQVINGKGDRRGRIEVDRQVSSTIQYDEVSSTTPRPKSRGRQYHGAITSGLEAANKYEEYDIDGQRSFDKSAGSKTTIDLKNLKLDKNKKTVIVVSQVSDANPVLIGKLAGQCSCQSNMLELRGDGKTKGGLRRKNKFSQNQQQATITNEYLPPFETDPGVILNQGQASTPAPETVVIDGSKSRGVSYTSEQNFISSSTTAHPAVSSSTILSSLGQDGVLSITPKLAFQDKPSRKKQFRGRARFLAPTISEDGSSAISAVPASEIASTLDYRGDESRSENEIDGGKYSGSPRKLAGAAYDRYGPGGWRSFDETLQGSIDCQRPGLFRHPKYCNKFYACNYDPWEERYTLHVFNCPIQLTYDSSISACNWPVRGPACADDNLLV